MDKIVKFEDKVSNLLSGNSLWLKEKSTGITVYIREVDFDDEIIIVDELFGNNLRKLKVEEIETVKP